MEYLPIAVTLAFIIGIVALAVICVLNGNMVQMSYNYEPKPLYETEEMNGKTSHD